MTKDYSCRQYFALRRKSWCIYLLFLCFVFTTVVIFTKRATQYKVSNFTQILGFKSRYGDVTKMFADVRRPSSDVTQCGSMFPGMLHGRWAAKKNVSEARKREMDEYLYTTRGEYRIPRTLQRSDGRCGNLPYDGVPLYRFMWFRSLCNPKGPTPCCYDFNCTSRSMDQCKCPNCLDSRAPVHAELSDWLAAKPECQPREFHANQACELLKGTTLVLAGDSFVRHVFVALVMLLTDDFEDGALRKDANNGTRNICLGMYQINGLRCRDILDQNRMLCNGTVQVTYLEIFHIIKGRFLLPYMQNLVSRKKKVLLFLGTGIQDDFRADLIWPIFLQPVVEYMSNTSFPSVTFPVNNFVGSWTNSALHHSQQNTSTGLNTAKQTNSNSIFRQRKWPKMIFANTHAPGLLKSPLFPAQSYDGVLYYNNLMAQLLKPYGIPVLDSFNMTAPLHSVDGTHYGYGVNHLKVQFLLNWVKERQDREEW